MVLNCGVGAHAGKREALEAAWPALSGVRWVHSASAGLEHLLFPGLVGHAGVQLTNAKGVYSHSLAEYALFCMKYFALDFPRVQRAMAAGKWEPFTVQELRGRTLGVVGYGDIGRACAALAKAQGMRVLALRRSPEKCRGDPLLDEALGPSGLLELAARSDYLLCATPHTPETDRLVSAEVIGAMPAHGVFVNVGRGRCVDEAALVAALRGQRIKGAALDVFETEPLPEGHVLFGLDNVLLTPHCADRTQNFQEESLDFFVENMRRYVAGEPLQNVVDKAAGY